MCENCGPKVRVGPPISNTTAGVKLTWGSEHMSKGRLISRQASIPPPKPMTCLKPSCYFAYLGRVFTYMLVNIYHSKRVAYAEKHRRDAIPEKYRTGEPSPEGILSTVKEILKLSWR